MHQNAEPSNRLIKDVIKGRSEDLNSRTQSYTGSTDPRRKSKTLHFLMIANMDPLERVEEAGR
ncbi:MAG: hypothetical protein ABIH03_01595, partial [Pseudomonadota bacterium]